MNQRLPFGSIAMNPGNVPFLSEIVLNAPLEGSRPSSLSFAESEAQIRPCHDASPRIS